VAEPLSSIAATMDLMMFVVFITVLLFCLFCFRFPVRRYVLRLSTNNRPAEHERNAHRWITECSSLRADTGGEQGEEDGSFHRG
jgi:uncharacterized protein HemY